MGVDLPGPIRTNRRPWLGGRWRQRPAGRVTSRPPHPQIQREKEPGAFMTVCCTFPFLKRFPRVGSYRRATSTFYTRRRIIVKRAHCHRPFWRDADVAVPRPVTRNLWVLYFAERFLQDSFLSFSRPDWKRTARWRRRSIARSRAPGILRRRRRFFGWEGAFSFTIWPYADGGSHGAAAMSVSSKARLSRDGGTSTTGPVGRAAGGGGERLSGRRRTQSLVRSGYMAKEEEEEEEEETGGHD